MKVRKLRRESKGGMGERTVADRDMDPLGDGGLGRAEGCRCTVMVDWGMRLTNKLREM